jgi:HAMP domain-containing protein
MQERFSATSVVATFPNAEAAREAILDLERQGVDNAHIALLEPSGASDATISATRANDASQARRVVTSLLGGGIAGSILGGLAGALGGLVTYGPPGFGSDANFGFWLLTLTGVLFGGGLGLVLGGVIRRPQGRSSEPAQPVDAGTVQVTVQAADLQEVERATAVLGNHHALGLDHSKANGRSTSAPSRRRG